MKRHAFGFDPSVIAAMRQLNAIDPAKVWAPINRMCSLELAEAVKKGPGTAEFTRTYHEEQRALLAHELSAKPGINDPITTREVKTMIEAREVYLQRLLRDYRDAVDRGIDEANDVRAEQQELWYRAEQAARRLGLRIRVRQ